MKTHLKAAERRAKEVLPERLVDAVRTGTHLLRYGPQRTTAYRAFRRLNADAGPGRIAIREGLSLAVNERTAMSFRSFCWRSLERMAELDFFLAEARGKSRLVDVGCSHGMFSLAFCAINPDGRVIAIDPSPIAKDSFLDNVERNGFGERITFLDCAAGRSGGTMQARYHRDHVEASAGDNAPLAVPTRSIDEICRSHDFWPEIVKMDVDGFERPALEGATETLRRRHVLLLLEVHPELLGRLGDSSEQVFELLAGLGHTVFDQDGSAMDLAAFKTQDKELFNCTSIAG